MSREEREAPRAPCNPRLHKFAMNGKCWTCGHNRDDLIQAADGLLELERGLDRTVDHIEHQVTVEAVRDILLATERPGLAASLEKAFDANLLGCPRCKARDQAKEALDGVEPDLAGGGKLLPWLKRNPDAKDIVELWLDAVPAGESNVSMRRLLELLRSEHGLPWRDATMFGRRLREIYGDRYEAVMEVTRKCQV